MSTYRERARLTTVTHDHQKYRNESQLSNAANYEPWLDVCTGQDVFVQIKNRFSGQEFIQKNNHQEREAETLINEINDSE